MQYALKLSLIFYVCPVCHRVAAGVDAVLK
nr:MAG TPA: desulfoferrodoxin-like protein [Caudoviricetes sp.]